MMPCNPFWCLAKTLQASAGASAFPGTYVIAVVCLLVWAWADFDRPFVRTEIKYATRLYRYILGKSVYAASAAMGFTFIYLIIDDRFVHIISEGSFRWISAAAALLASWCVLIFPATSGFVSNVRTAAQSIALYPYSRDRLTALVCRMRPEVGDGEESLTRELARYGLSDSLVDGSLVDPAKQALLELEVLRNFVGGFRAEREMETFCRARKPAIEWVEVARRRLLRRVVRVLKAPDGARKLVFEFAIEDAQGVIQTLKKLIAEAALSTQPSSGASRKFIARVGFKVERIAGGVAFPPFFPLALTFFAYCLLFGVPIVIVRLELVQTDKAVPNLVLSYGELFHFLIQQAFGQLIAIALAVRSCVTYVQLDAWPRRLIYSCMAYCIGLTIAALIVYGGSGKTTIQFPALALFSLLYPLVTFSLAIALEERINAIRSGVRATPSWRNGVIFALIFWTADIVIQIVVRTVVGFATVGWPYVLVWTAYGALIGSTLPGSIAKYLTARGRDLDFDRAHGPYAPKHAAVASVEAA